MTDTDTIGARIRAIREAMRMTRSEFARRVGVSTGAITRWESDDRVPSMPAIQQIMTALKIPADTLIPDLSEDDTGGERGRS